MQHFFYKAIPTVKQFQSDSSVTFAVRGEDKILKHLDWLLERYHLHSRNLNADLQRIILCEIFLGANYWIKAYHEKKPAVKKERSARLRAASHHACLLRWESKLGSEDTVLVDRPGRGYGDDYTPWLVDAPVGQLVRVRAAAVTEEGILAAA